MSEHREPIDEEDERILKEHLWYRTTEWDQIAHSIYRTAWAFFQFVYKRPASNRWFRASFEAQFKADPIRALVQGEHLEKPALAAELWRILKPEPDTWSPDEVECLADAILMYWVATSPEGRRQFLLRARGEWDKEANMAIREAVRSKKKPEYQTVLKALQELNERENGLVIRDHKTFRSWNRYYALGDSFLAILKNERALVTFQNWLTRRKEKLGLTVP